MAINQQIHLVSRPTAEAVAENFRLIEAELPDLGDGQVLVRHHYLSLDPYMRGRMNDAKSYAPPQALNTVMQGGTVGEVVASRHAGYAVGDRVVGFGGWQQFSVVDAGTPGVLRKVDTTQVPLSAYLGAVGMPGVTAWYGLAQICRPEAGKTVTVSAASGAVGSAVGQLAKARGCRAVGIAGGVDKCRYVVDELGFDACIDYKAHQDPEGAVRGAEGRDARRRRRPLRERRRHGPRRGARAHEPVRPDRAVRNDQRLRRRADSAEATAADPDQPADDRGLHRQRAHGDLARSAEGTGHAWWRAAD